MDAQKPQSNLAKADSHPAKDPKGDSLQTPGVVLPKRGLRGKLAHWAEWGALHLPEKWFLMYLATLVGIVTGAAAWCLHWSIGAITDLVIDFGPWHGWYFSLLFAPVVGFAICYLFCKYVVKQRLEFGTQKLRNALAVDNYKLSWKTMFSPIIACATTLGFGGSAGAEGPIAFAGAGIGSNLGQYFELQPKYVRILFGVGAGAGIAAIFKAPVGGIFFTLEVLKMDLCTISAAALVAGCLCAWGMIYLMSGMTLQVPYNGELHFQGDMFLPMVCLGVFCGMYSLYYSWVMRNTESVVKRVRNPWLKLVLGGLCIGVLLLVFPDLYAEGYPAIIKSINGEGATIGHGMPLWEHPGIDTVMWLCAGMMAVKSLATAVTNSSGGVGGEFAPTLFAGALAGLLFALCCNQWLGMDLSTGDFALYGMAGVMAGAVQAPLMAMFIVVEMCGDFGMFFPLMLCATISFIVTQALNKQWRLKFAPAWSHLSM